MTTLALDAPRNYELGDRNEFPVIATDIIYEGAAVGLVAASGHARPLTSADKFVGFAEKKVDNSLGAAAAVNVRTIKKGIIQLSVSGAVITDIGAPVYATDDNTFVFTPVSSVFIGFVRRFVSSGVVMVEFDVDNYINPHEGFKAEAVTSNLTIDAEDTGKVLCIGTDNLVHTLPAVEGIGPIRFLNIGAYGTVGITVSPNANDMIEAADVTANDNKDFVNTKATACRGDFIDVSYGDANGYKIIKKVGTWARET